ncbi:MAG: hypothetical protein HQL60_02550 [Magnetococcales bacterium]|nr:hypothetical protein [Magnetococcales bacterium]
MEGKQHTITFISVAAATQVIYAGSEHPCYGLAERYLRQRFESNAQRRVATDSASLVRAVQCQQAAAELWAERIHNLHLAGLRQLEQVKPAGGSLLLSQAESRGGWT